MTTILLVIHLMLCIALVAVILVQRAEGGLGGLGGGMGGVMTGRAAANVLTRTTAVLAGAFMATSLLLAILHSGGSGPASILDSGAPPAEAPAEAPAPTPEESGEPSVPLQQ
jgi:preprotein translocase subunit SecG